MPGLRAAPELPAASLLQDEGHGQRRPAAEAAGASLSERLRQLDRLMQTCREEEAASELHLSALLDMVDI